MKKNFTRSVVATLICSTLLLIGSSCGTKESVLEQSLNSSVSEDIDLGVKQIPYFASWQVGLQNHVSILVYKQKNLINTRENENRLVRVDYIVSKEDYNSLQESAGSFEAITPFNDEVLEKLNYIVKNYEPTSVGLAVLKDNGQKIVEELIK